jgi:DNA-binding MarR family transcriptional regulator
MMAMQERIEITSSDLEVGSIYAAHWRMIYMGLHKYDSKPIGELLTVMTIALLDKAGYHPTVSELAEITGLAKSNVSRYITNQMKAGYIVDVITPQDRRRRRLCPTEKGKKEAEWNDKKTLEIARSTGKALQSLGNSKNPVSDLKKILLEVAESA